MSGNRKSSETYMNREVKKLPTEYSAIGLAVDPRIQKFTCKEMYELGPYNYCEKLDKYSLYFS